MNKKGFFIASTGQHVGKTTACLGLVSGLKKRFDKVGFMKPVGQEHVETETGHHVDKDVLLFKTHFQIENSYKQMSPVLFPRGFTRDYLDGKILHEDMTSKIEKAFRAISLANSCTVVEGTGHIGVGSIVNLNNAQVAKQLGLDIILVASGGLGSSFDALTLNKIECERLGVKLAGVILNRVYDDKREMVIKYMSKALDRWNIPLLGCIPFNELLSAPSMRDFEQLFEAELLSGKEHLLRHFHHTRLVASSVESYRKIFKPNLLIITPADREDIILATLTKYWDNRIANPNSDFETGMILTGESPPKASIVEQLRRAHIPMLYASLSSYKAMKRITSYTAKIQREDVEKVLEAIKEVESHIDFHLLQSLL